MKDLLDKKAPEETLKKVQETGEKLVAQARESLEDVQEFVGSRINPLFIAGNKVSSTIRQALALEPDRSEMEPAEFGDILSVRRVGFAHYGVYVGNNQVIHYDIDPSDHYKICVHQASIEEFLNGSEVYSVCDFPKVYGRLGSDIAYEEFRKKFPEADIPEALWESLKNSDYYLYTPEDTVRRARERIGETEYDLLTNNCEHFAFWCKTGLSESLQIDEVISALHKTGRNIREALEAGVEAAEEQAALLKTKLDAKIQERQAERENS